MIPRYTLPEMAAVWSEEHRLELWLRIEVLACEGWAHLGRIPGEDAAEIRARAMAPTPQRVAEIEAVTDHDVAAFVQAVAEPLGRVGRWVHFGLTSSDLLDTGLALQLRDAADLLLARLERLLAAVRRRALEHRETLCVGRTHGVHAEPTTFGHKLAVLAFELDRDRTRLRRAREAVSVGKLSGVVGTYSQVDPAVEEYVCAELGLRPADAATQVVQRDVHAEYVWALAATAATVERLALEIRHLARTEVREAQEPFRSGQKGSSAMPHKRNPILSERLCGLARVVRTDLLATLENVALWHERDISHSSVERVVLPDVSIALDYMLHAAARLVDGLVVFPERMRENLEATRGLVYSQRVLLELIDAGLGRDEAYGVVQRASARVWDEGVPFAAALAAAAEGAGVDLERARLDALFDPKWYVRNLDGVFARLEKLEASAGRSSAVASESEPAPSPGSVEHGEV